ncbi:unnamed protein product [Orchesella dallaii]|uniref:Uncharacterized protein n=1 Tax=Orchesella dallaii TaxID=48710 RepID=A0ABP1Q1N4_9HEXA
MPLANGENEECVGKENQHSTPTTSNEQAEERAIVNSDAGSFIAPEAQYSQSNNDSALFFGSEEFDFDSKLNGERKYYLEGIESVASSEKRCFICPQKSRIRVPVAAIDNLYIKHRIYVPPNNRCCPDHLIDGVFSADSITIIQANSRHGALLSPNELGSLLNRIADEVERNRIDFDSNLISDYEYELLLGVSKENSMCT